MTVSLSFTVFIVSSLKKNFKIKTSNRFLLRIGVMGYTSLIGISGEVKIIDNIAQSNPKMANNTKCGDDINISSMNIPWTNANKLKAVVMIRDARRKRTGNENILFHAFVEAQI